MNYPHSNIYNHTYLKNNERWAQQQQQQSHHYDNQTGIERERLSSAHFPLDSNESFGEKERSSFSIRKSISSERSRSFRPKNLLHYDYASNYPINSYGTVHDYSSHYDSAYSSAFTRSRPPSSRTSTSSFFMDSVRDREKKHILVEKDRITSQMNENTNTNNNLKGIFSYSDDTKNLHSKQQLTSRPTSKQTPRPTSKNVPRTQTPTPAKQKNLVKSPRTQYKENLSPKIKGLQEVNEPLPEFPESRYDERFTEPKNLPFEETKQEADRLTKEEKKTLKRALERQKSQKQSKLAEIKASGERITGYKNYDEVFHTSASESEEAENVGATNGSYEKVQKQNVGHKIPDIEEEDDEEEEDEEEEDESDVEYFYTNDDLDGNDDISDDDENEMDYDDEDDVHIDSHSENSEDEDFTDIDFCVNDEISTNDGLAVRGIIR